MQSIIKNKKVHMLTIHFIVYHDYVVTELVVFTRNSVTVNHAKHLSLHYNLGRVFISAHTVSAIIYADIYP